MLNRRSLNDRKLMKIRKKNKNYQTVEGALKLACVVIKHTIFESNVQVREHHASLLPTKSVTFF